MKNHNRLLIAYKTLFGLLGFSALVTEIATTIERGTFNPANFFSYFTVETNAMVAVILLLSALATAAGKNATLDTVRSAVTVYILIVGIGFSLLLSGLTDVAFTAVPWDNIVLHYIMPVAMLVDWLLDRPRTKLRFTPSLVWLVFPLMYILYSLVRGAAAGWYPYPFLNPNLKGYSAVIIAVAGMSLLATGLIWIVCRLPGACARRPNVG